MREIAYLTKPATVNVADKPPLLNGQIRAIPVQEFEQQIQFSWSESLFAETEDTTFQNYTYTPIHNQATAFAEIQANYHKMAVCFMDEKVGYGVFATDSIPANSYVSVYSGCLFPINEMYPRHHDHHQNPYALSVDQDQPSATINCKLYGNYARFFQHLPEPAREEEIDIDDINIQNYRFSQSYCAASVAVSNLTIDTYSYQNYPLLFFKTTTDIQKGEPLGWDYKLPYWLNHGSIPFLFDKKGAIIATHLYTYHNPIIKIYLPDHPYLLTHASNLDFEKDDLIILSNDKKYVATIIESDFNSTLKKFSHSPFLIFEKPSALQSLGLFLQAKKTSLCDELNRITQALLPIKWRYNLSNDTAFLEATDQAPITTIYTFLKHHSLEVNCLANPDKTFFRLVVPTFHLNQLKKIPACMPDQVRRKKAP